MDVPYECGEVNVNIGAKLTGEQFKELTRGGVELKLEERKNDDEIEEEEEPGVETPETETIEVPFPKLDEEFNGKVSFADRCKLMETIEEGYIHKRIIRPASDLERGKVTINHAALIHINAFLEEKYDEPFDSTYIRKKPLLSKLSHMLKGYAIALLTMNIGEMAEFAIHYGLAFGRLGCPPRIPERSNLIVIIEVLDAFERGTVEYFHSLSIYEQDEEVTPEEVIQYAKGDLKIGNELFRNGDYTKAITHFRRASTLIERVASNTTIEDDCNQLLMVLYKNAAVCAYKLENGPTTVNFCRRALRLDSDSAKAHFLLAHGYILLNKLERAKLYLKKSQTTRPYDQDIKEALEKLDQLIAESRDKEAELLEKAGKTIVPFNSPTEEASEKEPLSATLGDEIPVNILNILETMEESEQMWDICGEGIE